MNDDKTIAFGEYLSLAVISLVALFLQGMLSPYVTIGYASPDFVLIAVVIIALYFSPFSAVIAAFLLGFLYNCLFGGVVGAMAVTLLLVVGLVILVYSFAGSESLVFALLMTVLALFLGDSLYAVITSIFSVGVSLQAAFVYRALPCSLYDVLLGCTLYFAVNRILALVSNKKNKIQPWQI